MNALEELQKFVSHYNKTLKCATITNGHWEDYASVTIPVDFTESEYSSFTNQLSTIEYYPGYGLQELYGILWFTDGTWADRGEYVGSEWWQLHSLPVIPTGLLRN
jgi:hypothetical protein